MIVVSVIKVAEITITKVVPLKGSKMTTWNVALGGVPFGQIWTFKAKGEIHCWHAKALSGAYAAFDSYAEAETFMRGCM